jgi:hypothetical protein
MGNAKDRVGGIDEVHYAPGFTLVTIIFHHFVVTFSPSYNI